LPLKTKTKKKKNLQVFPERGEDRLFRLGKGNLVKLEKKMKTCKGLPSDQNLIVLRSMGGAKTLQADCRKGWTNQMGKTVCPSNWFGLEGGSGPKVTENLEKKKKLVNTSQNSTRKKKKRKQGHTAYSRKTFQKKWVREGVGRGEPN